jgi:S-adenosylmethionine hydrolase
MERIPLITLTTDFGTADGYVGAMKGVILTIAPDARLVDISHEIMPQSIRQAAYVLYTAYPFFPSHTIHLVVVDPGVGGARRPIALHTSVGTFVGPDNGVFSYVMARERIKTLVELADPRYCLPRVGHTFHGRDIFAPAAAHLAAGIPITVLGPSLADPVTFSPPRLEITADGIVGEVLHVDRFGNIITSIGQLEWDDGQLVLDLAFQRTGFGKCVRFDAGKTAVVAAGQEIASVRRTYAEVDPGETLALVGSGGHLEIAVREASAARKLGLCPGDKVALHIR